MSNVQQPATRTDAAAASAAKHESRAMVPRVDVLEDQSGITLLADLPGVTRDQLELKVEGDTLWIEGAVTTVAPEGLEPAYVEVRVAPLPPCLHAEPRAGHQPH